MSEPLRSKIVHDVASNVQALPTTPAEVAKRLQRRLSAYGLIRNSFRRDVEVVQRIVEAEIAGFPPTTENQRELADIALRLHDTVEVL